MITVGHRARARIRAGGSLAMIALLSACGSGGHTAPTHTQQVQQTCQRVSAVLGDGPDAGTDPIGHAEAQILPLEQIHAADQTLSKAIGTLASAYSSYITAKGTDKAVNSALAAAINRINSVCPGAGAAT